MKLSDNVLSATERAVFALRGLYRSRGYTQYKMSKFEEYDLYAENKSFLISDRIITFTGIGGKLMALKPDVTLSIVKSTKDSGTSKVFYNENVYRTSGSEGEFKEIMQTGLECIGEIDDYSLCEVIDLAARSLETVSQDFVLDISHLGIVSEAIERLGVTSGAKARIFEAIKDKNLHSALSVCDEEGVPRDRTALLESIISVYGEPRSVLDRIEPMLENPEGKAAASQLRRQMALLSDHVESGRLRIDFSVTDDTSYYCGIVMSGFVKGISQSILSGGQYDKLLHKMGKKSGAVGFALYLDLMEELEGKSDDYDVDVLLLYGEGDSAEQLQGAVRSYNSEGKSVTAQRSVPEKLRYRTIAKLSESGVM